MGEDCALGYHRCHFGECIHSYKLCDGVADCLDMSDKLSCTQYQISTEHSSCLTSISWANEPLYCPNTDHLQYCELHVCPSGFKCSKTYCISIQMVCDSIPDCPGKEDELHCNLLIVQAYFIVQ